MDWILFLTISAQVLIAAVVIRLFLVISVGFHPRPRRKNKKVRIVL